MNRVALKNLTHNAKDFLSISKPEYKQWVFRYTFLELEKDLSPNGDITSKTLFSDKIRASGTIFAQEEGILAGIEELKYFLIDSDPRFKPSIGELKVDFFLKDGEKIEPNDKICTITGNLQDVLAVERVSLNLLMRMSGVATKTRRFIEALKNINSDVLITSTRKTLWGLLDKKAVTVGGGGTHRLNLSDAVLIKDTHLKIFGDSVVKVLNQLSNKEINARFIEIEVESKEQAIKSAETLNSLFSLNSISSPACIMFDNFSSEELIETLSLLKDNRHYDKLLFEASGGIDEENLTEYAKTGVDIISTSEITMNAEPLKFHLKITGSI